MKGSSGVSKARRISSKKWKRLSAATSLKVARVGSKSKVRSLKATRMSLKIAQVLGAATDDSGLLTKGNWVREMTFGAGAGLGSPQNGPRASEENEGVANSPKKARRPNLAWHVK